MFLKSHRYLCFCLGQCEDWLQVTETQRGGLHPEEGPPCPGSVCPADRALLAFSGQGSGPVLVLGLPWVNLPAAGRVPGMCMKGACVLALEKFPRSCHVAPLFPSQCHVTRTGGRGPGCHSPWLAARCSAVGTGGSHCCASCFYVADLQFSDLYILDVICWPSV